MGEFKRREPQEIRKIPQAGSRWKKYDQVNMQGNLQETKKEAPANKSEIKKTESVKELKKEVPANRAEVKKTEKEKEVKKEVPANKNEVKKAEGVQELKKEISINKSETKTNKTPEKGNREKSLGEKPETKSVEAQKPEQNREQKSIDELLDNPTDVEIKIDKSALRNIKKQIGDMSEDEIKDKLTTILKECATPNCKHIRVFHEDTKLIDARSPLFSKGQVDINTSYAVALLKDDGTGYDYKQFLKQTIGHELGHQEKEEGIELGAHTLDETIRSALYENKPVFSKYVNEVAADFYGITEAFAGNATDAQTVFEKRSEYKKATKGDDNPGYMHPSWEMRKNFVTEGYKPYGTSDEALIKVSENDPRLDVELTGNFDETLIKVIADYCGEESKALIDYVNKHYGEIKLDHSSNAELNVPKEEKLEVETVSSSLKSIEEMNIRDDVDERVRYAIERVSENATDYSKYKEGNPDFITAEEQAFLTDKLDEVFKNCDYCMRMRERGLKGLIESGKFYSQTENKDVQSNGSYAPELRKEYSEHHFGSVMNEKFGYACLFEKEMQELKPEKEMKDEDKREIDKYGDIVINFKKSSLEGRMAYYLGDSGAAFVQRKNENPQLGVVGSEGQKTTLSGALFKSNQELLEVAKNDNTLDPFAYVSDKGYLEVQILGGLGIDDVQSIGFPNEDAYNKLSDLQKEELKKRNINIVFAGKVDA